MAKSTLVSVLPFRLEERKPGLIPYEYIIEPATENDISILVITDGFHNVVIPLTDERTPPMRVTDTSEKIAESLILDYTNACYGISYDILSNGAIAIPGLFWIPGELSKQLVKAKYPEKIQQAVKNTIAWFQRLIMLADDDWQKTKQHKMITDLQRSACNYLHLQREWNFDVFEALGNLCWACKTPVNPNAIICGQCNAILNREEYDKKKSMFAA